MGESIFGKLRGVLSREKTSDIATQETSVNPTANLARIGMAPSTPQVTTNQNGDSPVFDALAAAGVQPGLPAQQPDLAAQQPNLPASQVAPVGIQFFAELPSQEAANEILTLSQRAENCLSAEAQPVGEGIWTVAITLCMAPVPQEIHAIETVLQTWAQKLGGMSKGWGLSQNQAA